MHLTSLESLTGLSALSATCGVGGASGGSGACRACGRQPFATGRQPEGLWHLVGSSALQRLVVPSLLLLYYYPDLSIIIPYYRNLVVS